jgi:hypothetical protein
MCRLTLCDLQFLFFSQTDVAPEPQISVEVGRNAVDCRESVSHILQPLKRGHSGADEKEGSGSIDVVRAADAE